MKRSHLSIACLFMITGLISCSSNDEEKQESIPGTGTLQTASGLKPLDTGTAVKQTNVTGALALNPEHGAPGHRCDITVGAPLNSAPVSKVTIPSAQPLMQQASPSQPSQPAPNNSVNIAKPPASNATTVTAGLNPAHGASGHRCDIAVGAPLNSAPVVNTPTQPIQIPAPVQQKNNNTTSTAKINPAHGQPEHDCSVPVGQPLKQ